MAINKENFKALFSVGDSIQFETSNDALHITAINDDHILAKMTFSGTDELMITLNDLSEVVDSLHKIEIDQTLPLHCMALEYSERHEDAIDEMWRRAGACQLP